MYVDDIIIISDDEREIIQLKLNISKEFEVKDLGQVLRLHRIQGGLFFHKESMF